MCVKQKTLDYIVKRRNVLLQIHALSGIPEDQIEITEASNSSFLDNTSSPRKSEMNSRDWTSDFSSNKLDYLETFLYFRWANDNDTMRSQDVYM